MTCGRRGGISRALIVQTAAPGCSSSPILPGPRAARRCHRGNQLAARATSPPRNHAVVGRRAQARVRAGGPSANLAVHQRPPLPDRPPARRRQAAADPGVVGLVRRLLHEAERASCVRALRNHRQGSRVERDRHLLPQLPGRNPPGETAGHGYRRAVSARRADRGRAA
ncbi:MAG: hypothetical protein BJ554DRAFT_8297 [Olpidium bornovanus]|uniref:Uncharacterized protein n=1 Tax=Olpidium bornovanus TaxID=278681 RepID=A0A8H7ZUT6_9FUNG|nr:MAG: hypothetical protein BJ554DRAFT_8297 [Olpidium bornovanus]